MKRLIPLLLCALLLCGCKKQPFPSAEATFTFYYPGESSLLPYEAAIDISSLTTENVAWKYVTSEPPADYAAATPEFWHLQSVRLDGSVLYLTFQGSAADPLTRSVSMACLTKTLTQLENVRSLSILTPGASEQVVLSKQDILFEDTAMLPKEETITLCYPDSQNRYLLRESMTVQEMSDTEKAQFVLEQLLTPGLFANSCIAEGTRLLSLTVENGVCTVNLSIEFQNMEQSFSVERMAVYSIVNTLTELPHISTVDIWVEGAPLETLSYLDLSNGLSRDESLFASGTGSDSMLYPACGDLLVPIPYRTESSESDAELLLEILLAYKGGNGIYNPIPVGTKLLTLRLENQICVVDLNGAFLVEDNHMQAMAIRSIVTTLCSLPEIRSVEILVEGLEPTYDDPTLSGIHAPMATWIAP